MDKDSVPKRRLGRAYSLLAALGTALVLAYLVTELQVRIFPGEPFALFIVSFVALFMVYLLGYSSGRLNRSMRCKAKTPGASKTDTAAQ